MKPRRSAWLRDEVIVALDLYLREGKNPRMESCAEVSSILRAIPIETDNLSDSKFRSPKSVASKMQNFVALDPKVARAGYSNVGQMDRDVWEEFAADPIRLGVVAKAIRANAVSLSPAEAKAEPEGFAEAEEGALLTRVHSTRERSRKLVAAKKGQARAETGRLACAACDLDFEERYGVRGENFIECHHVVPVSTLKPGEKTKIEDLVLLCANCHRMVHVRRPWLTIDELIAIQSGN
jgi:5-methylcytosine-specific restriction enzyme A